MCIHNIQTADLLKKNDDASFFILVHFCSFDNFFKNQKVLFFPTFFLCSSKSLTPVISMMTFIICNLSPIFLQWYNYFHGCNLCIVDQYAMSFIGLNTFYSEFFCHFLMCFFLLICTLYFFFSLVLANCLFSVILYCNI